MRNLVCVKAMDTVIQFIHRMKNFVSGVFTCPSKKAALLLCVVRVTVVLVSAIIFVTAKTAFAYKKSKTRLFRPIC